MIFFEIKRYNYSLKNTYTDLLRINSFDKELWYLVNVKKPCNILLLRIFPTIPLGIYSLHFTANKNMLRVEESLL